MIPGRGKPLTQEISESGDFSPLMLFDCRGYEPIGFVFGPGWKVESVSSPINLPSDQCNEHEVFNTAYLFLNSTIMYNFIFLKSNIYNLLIMQIHNVLA